MTRSLDFRQNLTSPPSKGPHLLSSCTTETPIQTPLNILPQQTTPRIPTTTKHPKRFILHSLFFSSLKRPETATKTTSFHHFLRPQEPTTKQTLNHLKKTRPNTKKHHPSTQKLADKQTQAPMWYFKLG